MDQNILITGGLGFLGSNLAHRLINMGANITILDNLDPRFGGNLYNVKEVLNKLCFIRGDVRDFKLMEEILRKINVIFHFAAQVSYIDSLSYSLEDLDLNVKSMLYLLEIIRKINPEIKVIFSSSRMVLGKINNVVFTEEEIANPLSLYGIHKLTSEKYLTLYEKEFGIKSIIFRITNPYGPRQQIKHSKYSLVGWFIRLAMENKVIKVFGEGKQIRDYIFIDDIVDGIIKAYQTSNCYGHIFNIGSGKGTRFIDMVKTVIEVVNGGKLEFVPWPKNYERIETGDSVADISKLKNYTDFKPMYDLVKGVTTTYDYYKKNFSKYL